jgi:hypothetical protein
MTGAYRPGESGRTDEAQKDHARDPEPEKLHPRDVPWCQEHRVAMVRGPQGRGWFCPTAMLRQSADATAENGDSGASS